MTDLGTKLSILSHAKDKTYVDKVLVESWHDLNIFHVKIDMNKMNQEQLDEMSSVLQHHAKINNMIDPLILMGDSFEIEIYHLAAEPEPEYEQLELEFGD